MNKVQSRIAYLLFHDKKLDFYYDNNLYSHINSVLEKYKLNSLYHTFSTNSEIRNISNTINMSVYKRLEKII